MSRNHLFKQTINPRYLLIALLLVVIGFNFSISTLFTPLHAQRIVSNITVILKQLPEKKQMELTEFYRVIENYINNFEWIEDDQGGELRISMQFLLTDISISGESRYRANLLVSNEKDVQYFDKRCKFAYQLNEQLYHGAAQLNSLTTLIDYYVYLILGHEFDKFSRYGGNPYFRLAQQRAEQGRFGLGHFVEGWDFRQKEIDRILSERYKPFRLMKDIFFYGIYLFDDKNEKGKGRTYIYDAIQRIEKGLKLDATTKEDYEKFLNAYSTTIVQTFKDSPQANEVFGTLIRIDPEHKATYEQYTSQN